MPERQLDRLEALVAHWRTEAEGYDRPKGEDPVLDEHRDTMACVADELARHLAEARAVEERGMARLAADLAEIERRGPCPSCDGTGVRKEATADA